MSRRARKFESEVHLGLLCIVFVLLFVNFISNYTLFKARTQQTDALLVELNSAAAKATRLLDQDKSQLSNLTLGSNLRNIFTGPDRTLAIPDRDSTHYFTVSDQVIANQQFRELVHAGGTTYMYVTATGKANRYLAIIVDDPFLSFLERSSKLNLYAGVVGLAILAVVYLIMSRLIFRPIRSLSEEAIKAGRFVDFQDNEAEAAVREYARAIRELKASESDLRRLNQELSRQAGSLQKFNEYLLTSMSSAIFTLDHQGEVITANSSCQTLLGIELTTGSDITTALETLPGLRSEVISSLRSNKLPTFRDLTLVTSGVTRNLAISLSNIFDEQENKVGLAVMLTDMTEITELRTELEAKRRLAALGEMAGGLAHQIRNSLGAINGYSLLIKRAIPQTNEESRYITCLLTELQQAEQLIGRFLSFTRPMAFEPEKFILRNLLAETINTFKSRTDYQSVTFSLDCSEEVQMNADALLLKQALSNLIDNALQALPPDGGKINIRCLPTATGVCLQVSDNGCGMTAEIQARLFTPFYSTRPSGTGLGLALVAKIINLHGGRIKVESAPSVGTTFTITLPGRELESMPVLTVR